MKKFLHWFYSFFVCLIGTSFHPKWGIGIALGLGVINELKDMIQNGNKWSWSDIAFDLLGIGLAWAVYIYADAVSVRQEVEGVHA